MFLLFGACRSRKCHLIHCYKLDTTKMISFLAAVCLLYILLVNIGNKDMVGGDDIYIQI